MLEGQIRESISKSQAKALRNDGYLIANIYGKGREIFIVPLNLMILLKPLNIRAL